LKGQVQVTEQMQAISIDKTSKIMDNSKEFPVTADHKYMVCTTIRASKGEAYSACFAVIILDMNNKEITRYVRWLNDFSGQPKDYPIVFNAPKLASKAILGYRANYETPIKSVLELDWPHINSLCLSDSSLNKEELYDDIAEPSKRLFAPQTQDYENVWDGYSKRFNKTADTENTPNLGDEWGNDELTKKVFDGHILPHLRPGCNAAELGVGGGKYSILISPHVHTLYGIDISNEMLKRTAKRLESGRSRFVPVKTDGTNIKLSSNSVDFIFSIDSCVHIFHYDLFRYLKEFARIMKSGARGAVEFADWDRPGSFDKFVFDFDILEKTGRLNSGAFAFIDKAAISCFLRGAGLKELEIRPLTPRSSIVTFLKG